MQPQTRSNLFVLVYKVRNSYEKGPKKFRTIPKQFRNSSPTTPQQFPNISPKVPKQFQTSYKHTSNISSKIVANTARQ